MLVLLMIVLCFFAYAMRTLKYTQRTEVHTTDKPLGYISLTTTPDRIQNDWILWNMERLVDVAPMSLGIVMHVPYVSKDRIWYAIPQRLKNLVASSNNRFVINRECDDLGPITKIVAALWLSFVENSDYIVVIDDDTCYKAQTFTRLLCALQADNSVVYAMCNKSILGYQGYAFQKRLLVDLKYLNIPATCKMIDDDVVEYFIKHKAGLRIKAVSLGFAGRTCSFDRRLTYQRPHKSWHQISNILAHHHSSMKKECLKDLGRDTSTYP